MAYVERRQTTGKDASGRTRRVTRYRVRYRDPGGKQQCETLLRAVDAERRRAEIELELANSAWRDPRQGDILLEIMFDRYLAGVVRQEGIAALHRWLHADHRQIL